MSAQAAGLPDFDAFANEMNFFLGAMLFEDVGVTAYKGSARIIRNKRILESAAGILASEGYHMGAVRSVIYKMGDEWRRRSVNISEMRDRLDGPEDLDQPVIPIGQMSNVVPANYNGIAFGRTPQHVLNIVYGNPAPGIMMGGFYPEGVNGRIRSTWPMTPPPDIAATMDAVPLTSLDSAHRSIAVPGGAATRWRKVFAFAGPGYLVAVGYIDPGNWATDLAGGSAFGYSLLSVILLSNFAAMVLQALAARLGIATGMDLAQACRTRYSAAARIPLWLVCEIAIIACDLAEVIGTAIALQLLFGLPLVAGVMMTALDVFVVLFLQQRGFRQLEAFIVGLLAVIATCLAVELALSRPELGPLLSGLVPSREIISNPAMLYVAIGIVGATVMPHNLYLHSAIVQTRRFTRTPEGKSEAIRFATLDSSAALLLALFINGAILVLAASTFHAAGRTGVSDIQQAYQLLTPMLGATIASTLFAIALLASGQNSTVTATLAGQIVMQGFLNVRLPPWIRRLVTRGLAIIPAAVILLAYGSNGITKLLIFSQVVLSLQLPFAMIPLAQFTSDRRLMGTHVNPRWLKIAAFVICIVVTGLNLTLLASLL